MPAVKSTPNKGSLGDAIADFRQRLRRPHSSMSWSQEDLALALACGTYQAHISQIERNQIEPQQSTLIRICHALQLSRSERAYLLSLAGHPEIASLPTEKEVQDVQRGLIPVLESLPYPATLMDEGERIWYYSRMAVTLFGPSFGVSEQQAFHALASGKRYLELIFSGDSYGRWKTCWENVDAFLARNIALFWRAYRVRQRDPDMTRVLSALKKAPEFLRRWAQIEHGERPVLFIEHGIYTLRHSTLGSIRYSAWRTHVAFDERFFVTHCIPMDSTTIRIFERLSRERQADSTFDHVCSAPSSGRDQTAAVLLR
jgi:transcriptional regulator with XRE-family HTH domain